MQISKSRLFFFKILSALAAPFVLLVTLEIIFRALLSEGQTFHKDFLDRAPNKLIASPKNYEFELETNKKFKIFESHPHRPKDKNSFLQNHHEDHNVNDLNMPLANFKGLVKRLRFDKKTEIFSVQMTTDEWGRRLSGLNNKVPTTRNLILMGGSYAFGEGSDDNNTILAHLETLHPQYKAYNLAFHGYGPNDVLARILKYNFLKEIKPSKGIGLYLYTDNHIKRTVNAMSVIANWSYKPVAIQEVASNSFKFLGLFFDVYPVKYFLVNLFWKSRIVRYFEIDWPLQLTSKHYDQMARVIKHLEYQYKKHTDGSNPFVVVIYPDLFRSTDLHHLRESLNKNKIYFLDFSLAPMIKRIPAKARHDYDGHPTAEANKHMAELISQNLKFISQ